MHTLEMMLLVLLLLPLATSDGDGRAVGGDRNPNEARSANKRLLKRPARRMDRNYCTPCPPALCCQPGSRCGTSTHQGHYGEPACV
nr:conotoxin precursor Q [Conus judaeus]UMA83865.1 conotoxin precursor Q [Conus judaeus]DAZ86858.1 TPA_inf: conotoxin precursor Q [Conus judaeus]